MASGVYCLRTVTGTPISHSGCSTSLPLADAGKCAAEASGSFDPSQGSQRMKASEVMTSAVTLVGPDTPIREVAKILREHGISAVPVVGEGGVPIGMISEGDLIGRNEADREARRDWWLTLLAEGEMLNTDFLASLRAPERRARDVMTAPVVTVGEETEVNEIARLLTAYRIKRVPVLRDGGIVGIVSRADHDRVDGHPADRQGRGSLPPIGRPEAARGRRRRAPSSSRPTAPRPWLMADAS